MHTMKVTTALFMGLYIALTVVCCSCVSTRETWQHGLPPGLVALSVEDRSVSLRLSDATWVEVVQSINDTLASKRHLPYRVRIADGYEGNLIRLSKLTITSPNEDVVDFLTTLCKKMGWSVRHSGVVVELYETNVVLTPDELNMDQPSSGSPRSSIGGGRPRYKTTP